MDDPLDACQQEGQPDDGGSDHREDGRADDQKLRPLVDKAGQRCAAPPHAQHTTEDVHGQPGQPNLTEHKPAVGLGQRQNKVQDAERVEG